ncbi:MAG: c-type cytochrome [Planctomycetes bacterium]|nr:c-type cytochrome [Planctomycetota bacterium]
MGTQSVDRLTDHEYDGIQEYDNPTPGWWNWLFWATILLCFPYTLLYHFGRIGWNIEEAYTQEQAANARLMFGDLKLTGDTETVMKYTVQPDWLAVGAAVFSANCANCHARDGAGMVGGGVNLTDDHYKNVKTPGDLARVIADGANNNAMPAWKTRGLHPNEIVLAASYVATLRGKNLPSPRGAPEGVVIPPWPKVETPAASAPAPAAQKK